MIKILHLLLYTTDNIIIKIKYTNYNNKITKTEFKLKIQINV